MTLRGEAGDVGRVPAAGDALDRMAGEVVDDGQRPAVLAIEPQHADLRIDRPDFGDLFVGRQRIGVPHVDLACRLSFSAGGSP